MPSIGGASTINDQRELSLMWSNRPPAGGTANGSDRAQLLKKRNASAKSCPECRALSRRPENARAETVRDKFAGLREQVVAANNVCRRVAKCDGPAINRDDDAGDRCMGRK